MDFFEDLVEGLTERKKRKKYKFGYYDNHDGRSAAHSQSRYCPKCSATVPPGARFCSGCGSAVNASHCPNCGAELTPEDKFCSQCGIRI